MSGGEPNLLPVVLFVWLPPFLAYFLGIVIRNKAMPGEDSPPLSQQLLLGIPVSLVVVAPLVTVLHGSIQDPSVYLFTLGMIMENGMLVHETATRQLAKLSKGASAAPSPTPAEG
ncbi:MAG: hypothetical protein GY867_01225 [bacterium]|nr:hypothetical protein [bacterium]